MAVQVQYWTFVTTDGGDRRRGVQTVFLDNPVQHIRYLSGGVA